MLTNIGEAKIAKNYSKEKILDEKVAPGKYYPPRPESFEDWRQVKKDRCL